MSIAVEFERFILTANKLGERIVGTYSLESKIKAHVSEGGNS
jgi:hypothetical protein